MNKFFYAMLGLSISSTLTLHAQTEIEAALAPIQNPPITVETLTGNRGTMYQLIVNKKFQSIPQLGFFSVTNGMASWKKEAMPDIMTQAHLTYTFLKGFDVTAGMQYTPVYGYRPVAGILYSYAQPDLLVIVNPKVDLAKDVATEVMGLVEYKPKLTPALDFYSRIQGLYGFVPKDNVHNRSYIMVRAGLSYKEFSFGLGSNFDWYGPMSHFSSIPNSL